MWQKDRLVKGSAACKILKKDQTISQKSVSKIQVIY